MLHLQHCSLYNQGMTSFIKKVESQECLHLLVKMMSSQEVNERIWITKVGMNLVSNLNKSTSFKGNVFKTTLRPVKKHWSTKIDCRTIEMYHVFIH